MNNDLPIYLPTHVIAGCKSYREAVRASWGCRRVPGMTQRTLAESIDCYASHVTDYLHPDDKQGRRNLPAYKLTDFAFVVGNWGVQQWLSQQVLDRMQAVIAQRAA